jgi:hypothetical protein|tara:strand:- start:10 stop:519 length:510 start_codon:yes stop_codon:yes gene_type:complete
MMNDGAPDPGLTPQDAFRMFDLEGAGKISKTAFPRVVGALGAGKNLPGKTDDSEERRAAVDALFGKIDKDKSGEISYDEFRSAWVRLVDVEGELKKRSRKPRNVPRALRVLKFLKRPLDMINRATLLSLCADEEAEEKRAFQRVRDHALMLRPMELRAAGRGFDHSSNT